MTRYLLDVNKARQALACGDIVEDEQGNRRRWSLAHGMQIRYANKEEFENTTGAMSGRLKYRNVTAKHNRPTLQDIVNKVRREHSFACNKFPQWPVDILHAASIVSEESGELTRACLQRVYEPNRIPVTTLEKIEHEAIQTAAMAIRFIQHLDDYKMDKSEQVYTEGEIDA